MNKTFKSRIRLSLYFLQLLWAAGARGEIVDRRDFYHEPNSVQGELRYEKNIHVGGDVDAKVTIDVTAKGNGLMRVLNLTLKVFDTCDDGQVYVDGLLHVEFVDLKGTGYKDLVITGTVVHTGEKETDPRT